MKGEKFIAMLNNHAQVINHQGDKLERLTKAAAWLTTRKQAEAAQLTGRFSLVWITLREIFSPGAYNRAVDAAHKALLAPKPPAGQDTARAIKAQPAAAAAPAKVN
jgi:hypothetical protein